MNKNDKPINKGVTSNPGKQDNKSQKNSVLNQYKEVYQNLFDLVPCFITVQDRDYKLLRFNDEFHDTFEPKLGDFCYKAYKGRTEKCVVCPVENTFKDGQSHWSEESGVAKDGSELFWVVKTAPIKNSRLDYPRPSSQ
jgi:histidine kinase